LSLPEADYKNALQARLARILARLVDPQDDCNHLPVARTHLELFGNHPTILSSPSGPLKNCPNRGSGLVLGQSYAGLEYRQLRTLLAASVEDGYASHGSETASSNYQLEASEYAATRSLQLIHAEFDGFPQ
jgi:hypothetical protein